MTRLPRFVTLSFSFAGGSSVLLPLTLRSAVFSIETRRVLLFCLSSRKKNKPNGARVRPAHNLYRALDKERMEIRLLRVKAGSGQQPLRCELVQAFLEDEPKPAYETISYCWGDPTPTETLTVNGQQAKVHASAKAALLRMRLPRTDRMLWIDSVCINQQDPEERGHQVRIMHEVYSNNKRNLVYLGEGDSTIAKGVEMIGQILANAKLETENFTKWKGKVRDRYGSHRFSDVEIPLDYDVTPLRRFYSSPWFRRLWVAQEAALSRTNTYYYGETEADFGNVLRCARWMIHKQNVLPTSISKLDKVSAASDLFDFCDNELGYYSLTGERVATLQSLVYFLRGFGVTDPRDCIYAVLGLHQKLTGNADLTEHIKPDYNESLKDVIRDATRYMLWEDRNLGSLAFVDHDRFDASEDHDWPSWVPYWHMDDDSNISPLKLAPHYMAHRGMTFECEDILDDPDPDVLEVYGYTADEIAAVQPVTRPHHLRDDTATLRIIEEIIDLLHQNNVHIDYASLGATLIGGWDFHRQATDDGSEGFLAWWQDVDGRHRRSMDSLSDEYFTGYSDTAWQYSLAVQSALANRCFFITKSGYIGIGPRTMEPGDVLVVLSGCFWPVILRPWEGHYYVLGTCYAYAVMNGEVVKKCQDEGKAEELFVIK